jgi:ribosomal protein S18 acetylase RimI-like enzyme
MRTIRRATIADIDQVVELFDEYRQFYSQQSDTASARKFLTERIENNQSYIFVAEETGRLVGFIQMYPTFSSVSMKPDMIMNDLYVFPDKRSKGIGKELLETAKNFAINNGYKGLWIETANDNPARYLYEQLGWEKDVSFTHYYWQP